MPSPDDIVVRLIVWEGVTHAGAMQQKQIKAHSDVLKRLINDSVQGTQWAYQRWKLHNTDNDAQKFEVCIRHKAVDGPKEWNRIIHELCERLLYSELATELRLQYPTVSFTFTPSQEGVLTTTDRTFAKCFSTATVRRYCTGNTYSKELEKRRDEFLERNSTKYIYQPMLLIHNVADLVERYDAMILTLIGAAEMVNRDQRSPVELADAAGKILRDKAKSSIASKEFQQFADNAFRRATDGIKSKFPKTEDRTKMADGPSKTYGSTSTFERLKIEPSIPLNPGEIREAAKLAIAIACQFVRAFVACSAEVKKKLGPKLNELNEAILYSRLILARDSYMSASFQPIQALSHLSTRDPHTADDLAMTINSFGTLMQTTLPLFNVTLSISDKEFTAVAGLAAGAGVGLIATGTTGAWIFATGATAGPVGLMAAAGVATAVLGVAAIREGIKWAERQKTNPSTILITIQKVMEECARFLLELLFVQAEMSPEDDKTHLQYVQALRGQLGAEAATRLQNKEYQKAYFKNTSQHLLKEMQDLQVGLERYALS